MQNMFEIEILASVKYGSETCFDVFKSSLLRILLQSKNKFLLSFDMHILPFVVLILKKIKRVKKIKHKISPKTDKFQRQRSYYFYGTQ